MSTSSTWSSKNGGGNVVVPVSRIVTLERPLAALLTSRGIINTRGLRASRSLLIASFWALLMKHQVSCFVRNTLLMCVQLSPAYLRALVGQCHLIRTSGMCQLGVVTLLAISSVGVAATASMSGGLG